MMDRSIPWWLRIAFFFIALQAFDFILTLFRPDLILSLEPWTATPLNARFISSLYLATGIGVLLCGLGRNFLQIRIVLIGTCVATSVILILTLYRLYFYPGEVPKLPVTWLVIYVLDPVLMALGIWYFRGEKPLRTPLPRSSNPLSWLWIAQTIILGLVGAVMLLLPGVAVTLWPWKVAAPLIQLYGAFFLGLALMAGLCIDEWRWEGVRTPAVMLMSLGIAVVLISLLHLDKFKSPLALFIWFMFFAAEALIFGGLLVVKQGRAVVKEVQT
jgi:hypothetical protein